MGICILGWGGGARQVIGYEIKRQSAYISLGLLALLFPFVPPWLIALGILLGTIGIIYMPKGSPLFKAMASDKDREAGLLLGPLKFCGALLVLAVLVVTLDFPVYVLAAVIGAVAFGEGSASLVNLLARGDRDVLWSVTLLVMGTAFAFIFGCLGHRGHGNSYCQSPRAPTRCTSCSSWRSSARSPARCCTRSSTRTTSPCRWAPAWPCGCSRRSTTPRSPTRPQLAVAVAIPFAIGIFSFKLNAVDLSGRAERRAGGAVHDHLRAAARKLEGFKWFAIILVFLFLGAMFTKYKYAYKSKVGAAEANKGSRGYKNVFGNCFVPLIFVVLYGVVGSASVPYFGYRGQVDLPDRLPLFHGHGDGGHACQRDRQHLPRPAPDDHHAPARGAGHRRRRLAAGRGGIRVRRRGHRLAALLMGLTGPSAESMVLLTVLMGFVGTNIDSLLGATLQQRKILSNAGVNFVATLITGLLAMLIYYLFFL